jgi:hypothetical protein
MKMSKTQWNFKEEEMDFILLNQKPQHLGREFWNSNYKFLTILIQNFLILRIFKYILIFLYLRKNKLKNIKFFYNYKP